MKMNRQASFQDPKKQIQKLIDKLEEVDKKFIIYFDLHTYQSTDTYFRDGIRKIDFVFVFRKCPKKDKQHKVNEFLANLEKEGFELEGDNSEVNPDLVFIKLFAPRKLLLRCACIFNIELAFHTVEKFPLPKSKIRFKCLHTDITNGNTNCEAYKRALEPYWLDKPSDITSAERITIVYELIKNVKYGDKDALHEFGVKSLLKTNHLEAAYALHDGGFRWNKTDKINDRQLLYKYWTNLKYFYKKQPLDLIYKYYGAEVAFYFAFMEHFIIMLLYPAAIGILSVIYGVITVGTSINYMSADICEADLELCPKCNLVSLCGYTKVEASCVRSKWSYMADNVGTFVYAIIMCFWATLFIELWKRKQAVLIYKWDLMYIEEDPSIRPEFAIKSKLRRVAKYTGKLEPYVKAKVRFFKIAISFTCIVVSAIVVIIAVILVIFLKIWLRYLFTFHKFETRVILDASISADMWATLIANLIIVLFMVSFEQFYGKIAELLTEFENPRTQIEYDKSYIYKIYVLSFLNAYTFLYYTSFMKRHFYSSPEELQDSPLIFVETCGPDGCILDITQQLAIILTGKSLFKSGMHLMEPVLIPYAKKMWNRKKAREKRPRWEETYFKMPSGYYYLLTEHKDTVIHYGYLILFSAAFPLAPLFSILFNVFMIRLSAIRLVRYCRRPVPIRVCGIGAWNTILQTLTYIGVATNAFLIAFSTNFVPLVLRTYGFDFYSEGYLDSILSEYHIDDYDSRVNDKFVENREGGTCYYVGKRFSAHEDEERKYDLSGDHYLDISMRFLCVLLIEGVVMFFTALLAFLIPDIPQAIKDRLQLRQSKDMSVREEQLNRAFKELVAQQQEQMEKENLKEFEQKETRRRSIGTEKKL